MSVIIPCFQEEARIAGALDRVLDQDTEEPFEVIVVDSSADRTAEVVREGYPRVKVIRSPERLTAGAARNVGLRAARAEKILFTDADVRVPRDWVRRLAAHLDEVGVAAGAIDNGTPVSLSGTALWWLEFFRLLPGRRPRRWPDARFAATANVGYRRDALRGRRFVEANAGEDIVLHHALIEDGTRSRFDPTLAVLHLNRRGWRAVLAKQRTLGAAGYRWRILVGASDSPGVRWPIVMCAKPFAVVAALLAGSLRAARPGRALAVLLLSPLLVALDAAWVVAYLRASRSAARTVTPRSPTVPAR